MRKKMPSSKQTQVATELVSLVRASQSATSRFEDRFWHARIESRVESLLSVAQDDVIEAALNELAQDNMDEAQDLLECVHAASQSLTLTIDNQTWQVLLVTCPFSVWTRYQLPQTKLTDADVDHFLQGLQRTVFATGVRMHALPKLLGLDEMPRSYSEIYRWLEPLAKQALGQRAPAPKTITIEPNPALLVDTRHFILAVAAVQGEPLFRWQADLYTTASQCQQDWTAHITPRLAQLMPGCQFHALLPAPYHSGVDLSERHVRMVAIEGASQWLHDTLDLKPGELGACIAAVGEDGVQEYRIGFYRRGRPDVIYGTIWPLFDEANPEQSDTMIDSVDEIATILKTHGVQHITRLPGVLWPESCEDCTAPFFPNVAGELVHVELPEEAFDAPQHFH
jgi:hypothetical protein